MTAYCYWNFFAILHHQKLCSIRNDVNSVSALIVANSVSFEKKVLILKHALPTC